MFAILDDDDDDDDDDDMEDQADRGAHLWKRKDVASMDIIVRYVLRQKKSTLSPPISQWLDCAARDDSFPTSFYLSK